MDVNKLELLLDSGWIPPIEERVKKAMEYLADTNSSEAEVAIEQLIEKFKSKLELQTRRISGSGCQQDFIGAYNNAYLSALKLKEFYKRH
ncbi:hypothetical protein [Microbulbifer taiwanensis]|uniref:Uncharacterized protein n=1 Tax=Microbulbifer taiwanensis TaxID=986746 RepID=A0ABW1YLV9_9GAMM|nr:hypothetical protein [Microbulbifer taiwanensis]